MTSFVFCQDAYLNQQKYWYMRQRLTEKFIKVGPGHGESLPAANYEIFSEDLNTTSDINKKLVFGSETTGRLGYYIGVLATEIKLLYDRGEDYSKTAMELYYALNAIDRLDDYAEMILAYQPLATTGPPPTTSEHCNPCSLFVDNQIQGNVIWDNTTQHWKPKPGSSWNSTYRNGYFVRSDAPPNFITNFPDANMFDGAVTRMWSSTIGGINDPYTPCTFGKYATNPDDIIYTTNGTGETSQDQIYGLLIGLKLVKQFVPAGITYNGEGLRSKAIGIAQRLLVIG